MSDVECWIYFEGPVPASVRPLLDALRGAAPTPTEQDKEDAVAEFFANFEARVGAMSGSAPAAERVTMLPAEAPGEPVAALPVVLADMAAAGPAAGIDSYADTRPYLPGTQRSAADEVANPPAYVAPREMREASPPSFFPLTSPAPHAVRGSRLLQALAVQPSEATTGEPAMGFEAWAELSVGMIGKNREEKLDALSARGPRAEDWQRTDEHHMGALAADLVVGRTERQALYQARCSEEMARRAEGSSSSSSSSSTSNRGSGVFPHATAAVADRGSGVFPHAAVAAVAASLPPAAAPVAPAFGLSTALPEPRSAEELEAMGKLPFVAAAPAPEPGKGTLKTMPVRMVPSSSGGTFGFEDGQAFRQIVAAVPFAGSAASASPVYLPELTVQQYVSLHFELVRPGPSGRAEALVRYRVPNEASMRALDQHWKERLAESPALRAEMDAAVATYTRWMHGLPR